MGESLYDAIITLVINESYSLFQGQFEHGLIFFHRGHALRPELDQFRLGIQKCQEAIENSVGGELKFYES